MIWNRIVYLAALAGSILFYSCYTGWFSAYLLLAVVCLPVFSLLLSLPGILRLQLQTETEGQCLRGESLQIQLFVKSGTFFPATRCKATVELQNLLDGTITRQTCMVMPTSPRSVLIPTAHCGGWDCTVQKAASFDFLGLFRIPLRRKQTVRVFVLPVPRQPDPLPDLSRFRARRYLPKPGGGFAEQHEMREYRPGDSMRQIHWKLTAKTDRVIVREPQIEEGGRILLIFDRSPDAARFDTVLDELCWLCRWMLEQQIEFSVCWFEPQHMQIESAELREEADLTALLRQALSARIHEDTPSIRSHTFMQAGLVYHVTGEAEQ